MSVPFSRSILLNQWKDNLKDYGSATSKTVPRLRLGIFTGEVADDNLFAAVEVNERELLDSTDLEANWMQCSGRLAYPRACPSAGHKKQDQRAGGKNSGSCK